MSSSKSNSIKFRNGIDIPFLGLGTTTLIKKEILNESEKAKEAIKYAIKIGYRHIDTATFYENEIVVGEAIKECGIDRKDIFITTKLHPDDMGKETTRQAYEKSLQNLGVDYIDLYLIHAPWGEWKPKDHELAKRLRLESWSVLIDLYNEGKCRAIGVSNYTPRHIQEIIDANLMLPMINQCEFHPYYTNDETFDFCLKNDILFEGYCPLARGAILKDETVLELAKKYSKTPAQIAIRWSIQMNVVTIPGSWTHARIAENFDVFDFMLDKNELVMLSKLNKNLKFCPVYPEEFV